jgi:hypothetical protein
MSGEERSDDTEQVPGAKTYLAPKADSTADLPRAFPDKLVLIMGSVSTWVGFGQSGILRYGSRVIGAVRTKVCGE